MDEDALKAGRERSSEAAALLKKMEAVCLMGGGEKGIARHVKLNKKILARERISRLLDPSSDFFELCMTAGLGLEYGDVPTGGVVAGVGKIHGTDVMLVANDGTVKGGTFYPITVKKQLRIQEIARQNRLPCVAVVDSGGGFLPLQADIFLPGGRSFGNQAIMSSEGIPQVALVSGLCTAGGAYAPTMSDIAAITHRIGNIYLGGPPLVKAATGEVVTGEELGGATMHCKVSGITDYFAKDEAESFAITRDIVASLNLEESCDIGGEEPAYDVEDLEVLSGLDQLDKVNTYNVIARILDGSRFLEFKSMFGENLITGYGFLKGQLVGILANFGPLSAADAQKGAHFSLLCGERETPLIFLQNGSLSDLAATDFDGTAMKERAKFMQAHSTVSVPKVTLNIFGSSGDENYTMCGPSFNPRFYLMWPRATLSKSGFSSSSPPEPETPGKKPKKKLSEFEFPASSAAWSASRAICDKIIQPAQTREVLARAIQICTAANNSSRTRNKNEASRQVFRM